MIAIKKVWFFAIVLIGVMIIPISGCEKVEGEDGPQNTITDIDGNVYKTVKIGSQVWMAENLRTSRYNNGAPIPTGHTNDEWKDLRTGAYAVYPHSQIEGLNSDAEVLQAYGALYNWYAIETGNLCPIGWLVPTDTEWATLINYAGGTSVAIGKLKSTRTSPDAHPRWESPNTGATDEYGFSALPGGSRYHYGGAFSNLGFSGLWWSSTEYFANIAWFWAINYNYDSVENYYAVNWSGLSIRCIKVN